jgi:hypothetical protein
MIKAGSLCRAEKLGAGDRIFGAFSVQIGYRHNSPKI